MSECRIEDQSINVLSAYASVPVAFEVNSGYEVSLVDKGLGGITLTKHEVKEPWVKDYDALADGGPAKYSERWDITNWGVFAAFVDGARVGGCVIANLETVYIQHKRHQVLSNVMQVTCHSPHHDFSKLLRFGFVG